MSRLHSYSESDVNFFYIDQNAKQGTPQTVDTFDKLIRHLERPIQDNRFKELYLVRGILVWIANSQSLVGPGARYNTPQFYIQQLIERRISASEVFRIFCGYAGIECTEVTGRAKAIRYRAGDGDSEYLKNHTWISFKADGKWHLMHPQWSIQAFVGFEFGGEIEIEKDGKETIRVRQERQGRPMYQVNDYWFCTAPEVFVTRCFPDEDVWQNPDGNILIKTVDEFLALPDLRQGFYDMKLSLLNEEKACVLQSKNGKCFVSIMSEKDGTKTIEFSYELVMEGTSGDASKVKNMKQLVIPQFAGKEKNVFKFEIRLPVAGTYWFRLAVGLTFEPDMKRNCCEFKIVCNEASKDCKRIPNCAGISAFGYGPQAEEAGLLSSSATDAKINVKPNKAQTKQTIAKFKTASYSEASYDAQMFGSDEIDGEQIDIMFDGSTEVVHDKIKGEVIVNASVPKQGEYAMVITAKDKADKKAKPVVRYLVTTEVDEDDKKNDALIKEREKEVRAKNHRLTKIEERNRLADILDAAKTELDALKVSGKKK